jgi:hypothetical protein
MQATAPLRNLAPLRTVRRIGGGVIVLGSGAALTFAQGGYGLLDDGKYGHVDQQADAGAAAVEEDDDELPLVELDEVRAHSSAESCWVCYGGIVFDITKFLHEHPVRVYISPVLFITILF